MYGINYQLIVYMLLVLMQGSLDINTGPLAGALYRPPGQYILSFTGPYGPPKYMSGHQISNSAGPNDDKSQYVLFARAPVPHLGSFRAVLLLRQPQRVASRSRACQSNTLTSVFGSRRMRYFNANIRDASGHFSPRSTWHAWAMVPSKQFCVLVAQSEILIDKSSGSMQGIVVTHLTVILSVIRVIVRLRQ